MVFINLNKAYDFQEILRWMLRKKEVQRMYVI